MLDFLRKLLDRQPAQQPKQPADEDSYLEAFFTDVEHLRNLFLNLATAASPARRILVIHGVGGVGKTTLLRMSRLACKRLKVPVALVGAEEVRGAVDMLAHLAGDLAQSGVSLPRFSADFERHQSIQAKVEQKAKRPEGKAAKLGKATVKGLAEAAASTIPVIGPLGSAFGGMGAEALFDWLRGFLSKPEIDFYLDPIEPLTDDFLTDVAKAATRQRLVLMLDTYEQMLALDEWVREWVKALHRNVLVVIAGRSLPWSAWERAWPGWMAQAQVEELQPMTEDDLSALVRRYYRMIQGEDPDPVQVQAVVRFARGLPLVATTAAQLWASYGVMEFQAVKAQVVADLVDRLLEGVPGDLGQIVEAAATLRWFDATVLQAVLEAEVPSTSYKELRRFPFVRPMTAGKLAVHDVVREIIDENLQTQDPKRHRTWHERAATYFEQAMVEVEKENRERFMLERLYHRVRAHERTGIQLFQETAEELVRYRLMNRLRTLLNDVNGYPLQRGDSCLWRKYYNSRLDHFHKRLQDAEITYRQLLEEVPPLDRHLHARVLLSWAEILTRPERLSQPGGPRQALSVLEDCERILPEHDPDWPMLLVFKAHVYERQPGGWIDAARVLKSAIATFREAQDYYGITTASNLLKGIYAHKGFWMELLRIHNEALNDLLSAGASPLLRARLLAGWKAAWVWMGRYAEAESVLNEVVDIEIRMGRTEKRDRPPRDLLLAIGMQKRCAETARVFDAAVKRYRALGPDFANDLAYFLGFWGMTALRCGKTEQAHRHLMEARDISHDKDPLQSINWSYWVGVCCLAQSHWTKAEDYFSECLAVRDIGRHYFECGALTGLVRVKQTQGDYTVIPAVLAEAERLALQYEYNDHLASLRLTQGHNTWDGHIPEWGSGFDTALQFYKEALIYALRYNRFLLDEVLWGDGIATPLRPIISQCLERRKEGLRMLVSLRDWWQRGTNDVGSPRPDTIAPIPEGISLPEAERIAREREPGDGSSQRTVVERLGDALARAQGRNQETP